MNSVVVYSSVTGNTKKVGEGILNGMPKGTKMYKVEEAPSPENYDFIVIGYWVDRGTADKKMRKYIENINNKKVIMFGTLGASTDSEHAKKVVENVKELLLGNEILGSFLCQGKIADELIESFKKLPEDNIHHVTEKKLKMYEEVAKHPDEKDIQNAEKFVYEIYKQILADSIFEG